MANNRGRSRGGRKVTNRRAPSALHKLLRGHEIRVTSMPPEFTSRPWFNITVAITSLPSSPLSSTQLFASLAAQLGIASVQEIARLELRLYTVKVWGPLVAAGSILQPLIVTIMDPLAPSTSFAGQRTLEEYTRYPDQVNRASIGYRYPIAQSDLVIQQPNPVTLLQYNGSGTGGLAIFTISFRFDVFVGAASAGLMSYLF